MQFGRDEDGDITLRIWFVYFTCYKKRAKPIIRYRNPGFTPFDDWWTR